jgi:predicted NodU family carbamoyl transferase
MNILGISLQHDAGAAIIGDGRIIAAINEERLNRQKLYWGWPELAIVEVIRQANLQPIDHTQHQRAQLGRILSQRLQTPRAHPLVPNGICTPYWWHTSRYCGISCNQQQKSAFFRIPNI